MSVEIWPPVSAEQLKIAEEETQSRELEWLVQELHETLKDLKHGLEDCYALLAPVDPGSTLVLSTSRNETVKGYITRVGTRIVKGTINLRLRTLPAQSLTINPDHPIHLAPLASLHSLLTHSIDLLSLSLSFAYLPDGSEAASNNPNSGEPISSPHFIAAQLRLLSQNLTEASALLKGPPLTAADPAWTTRSADPSHFTPPIASQPTASGAPGPPVLSFYFGIQDGSLVLWLRSLEPTDAPVHFGTKLAFAIGTARRLEHDEAERAFGYCYNDDSGEGGGGGDRSPHRPAPPHAGKPTIGSSPTSRSGTPARGEVGPADNAAAGGGRREVDVFVREKVRVESADPSLLALSAKLSALSHTLALARQNLATAMGEEAED